MGTMIGGVGLLCLLAGKCLRDVAKYSYSQGGIDSNQYGDDMFVGMCTMILGGFGVFVGVIMVIYEYFL